MFSTRPNTEMASVSSPDLRRATFTVVGGYRMSHLQIYWVSLRGIRGAVAFRKVPIQKQCSRGLERTLYSISSTRRLYDIRRPPSGRHATTVVVVIIRLQ